MDPFSFNLGCGLIATAPLAVGHVLFFNKIRYILLSWLCSFVSTVLLILCSLTSLFTENPWISMLFSVPIDSIGKIILRHFGCKMKFLEPPSSRLSLGLAMGMGYAMAHVLTLYLPIVFDQPYSVDISENHSSWFPNSLDMAIGYHASSVFQIATSLFVFRYTSVHAAVAYVALVLSHFGFFSLSMIPIVSLKLVLMLLLSYTAVIIGARSFRSLDYKPISSPGAPREAEQ